MRTSFKSRLKTSTFTFIFIDRSILLKLVKALYCRIYLLYHIPDLYIKNYEIRAYNRAYSNSCYSQLYTRNYALKITRSNAMKSQKFIISDHMIIQIVRILKTCIVIKLYGKIACISLERGNWASLAYKFPQSFCESYLGLYVPKIYLWTLLSFKSLCPLCLFVKVIIV